MLRNRVLFVAIAVATLAVATVFVHPEIALQGKVYSSSDSQAAAAFQRAGDDALEAGEFPHWNPFVFGGMPSYGSLAYNPRTYPLTGPIKLLREGFGLPPMTWLLVHYLVAALGVTGWLRWRCVPWPAAIAGGVLVLALPKMSAWGAYGHGTKLGNLCVDALRAVVRRGGPASRARRLGGGTRAVRGAHAPACAHPDHLLRRARDRRDGRGVVDLRPAVGRASAAGADPHRLDRGGRSGRVWVSPWSSCCPSWSTRASRSGARPGPVAEAMRTPRSNTRPTGVCRGRRSRRSGGPRRPATAAARTWGGCLSPTIRTTSVFRCSCWG